MKKQFKYAAMLVAALATLSVTSCSQDDDSFFDLDQNDAETRGHVSGNFVVIDFEESGTVLAGPTSYGENLYDGYSGTQPPRFTGATDPFSFLKYGINEDGWGGTYNFWNGGVAVSNWNYYGSNPTGKTGDWWYSYLNQCSVYNTDSTNGTNTGAGRNSNNFAILYGYTDTYSGWIACPSMQLDLNRERTFDHMYVCNSSYTWGVIVNGNSFTNGKLKDHQGYFKLVVRGYKLNQTTPVATDEIYLADYRNGSNKLIEKWTKFDLVNIKKQKINRIEFDYVGSDSGTYGLNTPAYVCIDDIAISLN